MSISLSSITTTSLILDIGPPAPPLPIPSAPFFRRPAAAAKTRLLRLSFANSSNTHESSNGAYEVFIGGQGHRVFDSSSEEKQGSNGKDKFFQAISLKEILTKLKRYGVSGILSYGLLNTAYYLTTFLVVWFYVAPAPGKKGYLAAVERFVKVMAMVWAGSQVTKIIRAGGALALAPFVDRGLSWFTLKFGFKSQGKAFATIAGLCFGLAFFMFVVVTLLSA